MIALYDWAFLSGYRLTCSDYTIALVGALSGAALVVKKRGVAARNSYLQQEVPSEDIEKTGAGEGNRTLIGQFLAEACMCVVRQSLLPPRQQANLADFHGAPWCTNTLI